MTIGLTTEQAEYGLLALTCHIPPTVPLGRPAVALREADHRTIEYATSHAFLWLYLDRAERLSPEDGGLELTVWRMGEMVGCRALLV